MKRIFIICTESPRILRYYFNIFTTFLQEMGTERWRRSVSRSCIKRIVNRKKMMYWSERKKIDSSCALTYNDSREKSSQPGKVYRVSYSDTL